MLLVQEEFAQVTQTEASSKLRSLGRAGHATSRDPRAVGIGPGFSHLELTRFRGE